MRKVKQYCPIEHMTTEQQARKPMADAVSKMDAEQLRARKAAKWDRGITMEPGHGNIKGASR